MAVLLTIAILALALLLFGLCTALLPARRRPPRDIAGGAAAGSRFERYVPRVVEEAAAFDALAWEDVYISSYDNLRLRARLLRGGPGCVILVHGYHSCAANDFAVAGQWYASRGYTLIAVDQRAHGLSGGRRLTFGARERRDVIAWAQYAGYVLGAERIWIHGVSMGASSALYAMGAGLPDGVCGVVADCPYDGVMGLFSYYFRRRLRVPAGLPAALAFPGLACALGFAFTRSTCGGESASCALPLLLIEAGEDTTVPPGSAGSILAARGGSTALVRFERAPHALCWQEDREKYAKALLDFGL